MTEIEYLLVCLGEECAEIAKLTSKSIRFGLNSTDPTQNNDTNLYEMAHELNDVLAVVEMLEERGVSIDSIRTSNESQQILDKKAKVEKYMQISRELGTLS